MNASAADAPPACCRKSRLETPAIITSPSARIRVDVLVPKIDRLDKALVAEMAEGVVISLEVLSGHDSERADSGQRAAVLPIQVIDTVAIDDQLALLAARDSSSSKRSY
jgi:hypothetical protein